MQGHPGWLSVWQGFLQSDKAPAPPGWFFRSLVLLTLFINPCLVMAQETGEIVSVLGKAEVLRDGRWQTLSAGAIVTAGETVRTGRASRVALLLADGSQLKLNANSTLELKPRSPLVPTATRVLRRAMRLLDGEVWLHTDGEPLEIETLPATATIRGTEFTLAVLGQDVARLAVLEGLVEFANPQGRVWVAANEQATAKVGEAPRKTVLINPLDAVQWSLYYPGVISYRDYPLSGIESSRLQRQQAAATARTESSPQDATAWIQVGEISFDLGLEAQTRQAFARALRLAPENTRARTGLGWVYLDAGEPEAALAAFDQARPATLMSLVGMANALYRLDRWEETERVITQAQKLFPSSPLPWQQAALNHLVRGQPQAAMQNLDRAQALGPGQALTYSLRSNILLVQNRKEAALEAAQQAVAANQLSPSAQLSLSLARQAEFQLTKALQAARRAVQLDPHNPQALIQESRLLFGMGQVKEAFALAKQARQIAPENSLVNSTWGFLQLARWQESAAMAAFNDAIAQDSTRGEPHLGRGLILFRQNQPEQAVEQMRQATLLEPKVSLYQSYLGKAYYEIKNNKLARKHLALAKQLDPRDPTPYFYNAIRLQSVNRPIEAVQDMRESIDLNDNRAVYRSRLLLDEDLAARGATLGRIYNDVGFEQLGLQEGQKSLTRDPANYSAHRLLADSYSAIPRHEIARASELLQSQLLQPLSIAPVQPRLAETDLFIPEDVGSFALSLNEYNPLFVRDRLALLASGVAGNNSTWGDEVVVSGISDRFSYSLGQFHYETDGFRENNDLQHDIYNAFAQFAVTPALNVQAEIRRRETEHGDLRLDFDADDFSPDFRTEIQQDSLRVGARFSPSPESDLVASYIDIDKEETKNEIFPDGAVKDGSIEEDGYQAEAQYLFRSKSFNLISGVGRYSIDRKEVEIFDFTVPFDEPCPFINCEFFLDVPLQRNNFYLYSHLNFPADFVWTLGLSYDDLEEGKFNSNTWNPKFGLQWNINGKTRLRLAAFRTVKPALVVEQTLEPTQIAGFNQFFDDTNAAKATRYGIGFDSWLTERLYAGIEASHREVEFPILSPSGSSKDIFDFGEFDENLYRAFFYWTLDNRWSLSAEPEYQRFIRAADTTDLILPIRIETAILPLSIRYSAPSGFFSLIRASYIDQRVERSPTSVLRDGQDSFFLLDAALGYRLPRRLGIVSLEALNLLDQNFNFQDDNFQNSDPRSPRFIPDRLLFFNFSMSF